MYFNTIVYESKGVVSKFFYNPLFAVRINRPAPSPPTEHSLVQTMKRGTLMPPSLTTPFTQERTWDADGIPVLHAAITLPCPEGGDKAARRIRRFYQLQARAFLRYCETFLLPRARAACTAAAERSAPLPFWEAELTYCMTYNQEGLWSLYTQSREATDEILLIRRGDTWDLTEAAPVPLGRFFRCRSSWRRVFYRAACEELERRQRSGAARLREDWRRQVKKALNPRDYYLTEEGVTFFLPMYAVGGRSEGIPAFTIPWREGASLRSPQTPPPGQKVAP